jgi:probable rRNA maturation factor
MRLLLPREGQAADPETLEAIRRTLRLVAEELRVGAGDVAVRCVEEGEMAELNATWREKSGPTDVLAFPAGFVGVDGRRHLGDIAICVPLAERQARERGHSLPREAALLALHGLLHLLGYDHERDDGEMEALEGQLRSRALPAP